MTGEQFREYRKAAGYTQKQLGYILGYRDSSAERIIQIWEHNVRPIPIKHWRTLSALLNITMDKFIP